MLEMRMRHGLAIWTCAVVLAVGVLGSFGTAHASAAAERGYEVVSPQDKNGGNVGAETRRTRAAAEGGAVQFESTAAFAGATGTAIAVDYIARRDGKPGTQGWSTHAITPPQEPLSFTELVLGGLEPRYLALSENLDQGIFLAHSPILGEGPSVAAMNTLYRRDGLLGADAATSTLLSDCLAPPLGPCASPLPGSVIHHPGLAGFTGDLGHVTFESTYNLTNDASGTDAKLYEWDHGVLRLAGILPDGSAASSSAAGQGAGPSGNIKRYTDRTLSSDGSRIVFTAPVDDTGAGTQDADLFLRRDHSSTVQVDAEERNLAPDPPEDRAPLFGAADADLTRIFFTTTEQLTDDATPNAENLFMWQESAGTETQTLTITADSGTFTIDFGGQVTSPLAFDASAATVENALNALSTIGGAGGSVTVTGGPGSGSGTAPYVVTFAGALAGKNVAPLVLDLANLGTAVGTTFTCIGRPDGVATKNIQWLRNGVSIPGANAVTYTTVGADAGAVIQCQVTALNPNAGSTQVATTGFVITPLPSTQPPTVPTSIAAPTVSAGGSLDVGSDPTATVPPTTLTCDPGAADWGGSPTFSYQWYRNGVPLSGNGADSDTYAVQVADVAAEATFQCAVTGTNAGGAAVRVSANLETSPGPSGPFAPEASASILPVSGSLTTVPGGHLSNLAIDNEPDDGLGDVVGVIGASEDGDYVYFMATSQLIDDGVPGSTSNQCTGGEPCMFVWHDGTLHQVGHVRVQVQDRVSGKATWTSFAKASRLTPDGTHLVFMDEGPDDAYDHGTGCGNTLPAGEPPSFDPSTPGCAEVYVYDATAAGGDGKLTCASCNQGGVHTTPGDASFNFDLVVELPTSYLNRAITDDGRYVYFSTGEPLVPQDTNGGVYDVYQYDTTNGELTLLSSGKSPFNALFMDASADGTDVFFRTREKLTGWDTDDQIDLYDARVGGGLPEPVGGKPECRADACLAPQSPDPSIVGPGTAIFQDSGHGAGSGRSAVFHAYGMGPRKLKRWAEKGVATLLVRISDPGRVSARVTGRIGKRMRRVARAVKQSTRGGTVQLKLRLSAAARAQLRHQGRLHVVIRVSYSRGDQAQRADATLVAR